MSTHPLPRRFYQPSARIVAGKLLGHSLVTRVGGRICRGIIVETEAYLIGDAASHSFGGRTARNRPMWGPPGHAYVYLIYGFHFCFNAVCLPEGFPEAVLVRAIEPVEGLEEMRRRRGLEDVLKLTSGPGKLCAAMGIDRAHDAVDLCDAGSVVRIATNPLREEFIRRSGPIRVTPRIGITKAAELPLRFYMAGSPYVSRGGSKKAKKDAPGERTKDSAPKDEKMEKEA